MANPTGCERTVTDSADTLPPHGRRADTPATIQQLLDDQRQSWLQGKRSRAEDYLQWMPQLAEDPATIVELLVGEFRLRQELCEAPLRSEFERRFPEHAARLRQQLISAGINVPDTDLAGIIAPPTGPSGTIVSETAASEVATLVDDVGNSHFTMDDPTEHGEAHSTDSPTSLIEASEALARELAERQASGRAGSPDRLTIVQMLKEAIKGSPQSRSKKRSAPLLRAVPGYDILAELGRGSVGVVYKARQQGLNRVVALKMILAGAHASRTTLARFRAEAEAVASLQHGNIVQVYEIGECDGLPFFSLEFCAGGSLAERLDGTPLRPDVASRTVVKLARAMHYAHGCQVVHRDLKPGNILLHPKDDAGRPADRAASTDEFDFESVILKVSDFGLAKRLDEESHTKTGAVLGTPSYMAPEQASGQIHDIGPPADIYALGAVLYELLTGRPPFRAATPLDTVVQVMHDEPVPPRRLHSGVPGDLETIALKCLQKDPVKRYRTSAELADDLQRYLDGEPIVARPIGLLERTWRWCRRNPLVATLSGLAATLLVAGTIVSLYFARQASHRALDAEKNEQQAKFERESARRSQYVAEMNLIQRAWRDVELTRVRALLQAQSPASEAVSDFRGPEWHYWNRLAQSELAVIPEPFGESPCLALSSDGLMVAAAGSSRTIVVWNIADWQVLARFVGHSDAIVGLDFLPDGRLISVSTARGRGDRGSFVQGAEIRIWSVSQKRALETHIVGGDAELERSALSPDGTKIAVADRNGSVTVAKLSDGSVIRGFDGAGVSALSVTFSPDGQRLAAGFANGDALVWSLDSGKTLKTYLRPRFVAHCVAFSPEGRRLAIGGSGTDEKDAGFRRSGDVRIVNLESDRVLAEARGHNGPVLHVEFSRDGQRLLSCGNDRTIRVCDAINGESLSVHQGHERAATTAIFGGDGRIAISAGDDQTARVWDVSESLEPWPIQSRSLKPSALAVRSDGQRFALAISENAPSITINELPSQQQIAIWPAKGRRITALAWHPTKDWIAAIESDGAGERLSVHSVGGTNLIDWTLDVENARDLLFSPDGNRIAILGVDRSSIVATNTGQMVAPHSLVSGAIVAAAFTSADSLTIASAEGGKLMIRDSFRMSVPRVIETGTSPIVSAALTRDARVIATASADRTIRLWDAVSGIDLLGQRLTGHVDKVADLEFSPDGRRLASAAMGYDHTTRIWDTANGQELLVLTSSSGERPSLEFSADGHWLAIRRDRAEFVDFRPIDSTSANERLSFSAARHYSHLPLAKESIVAALHSDRSLLPRVRTWAADMLSKWPESPRSLESAAWRTIRSAYSSPAEFKQPLVWTESQQIVRLNHGHILKGAAFLRNGHANKAAEVLTPSSPLDPGSNWERVRLVFLALAQLHLGRVAEAKSTWATLERLPAEKCANDLIEELRHQLSIPRPPSP